mmetsp:Transcript_74904/g.211861  ORF Transcript_74904/g.211861 Transcript_74904/m.211861 type:complete len:168 (+) Transcript_74904:98-601(+)
MTWECACCICGKSFATTAAMEQHQYDKGHFGCDVCGKAFGSESALLMHQRDTGHDYDEEERGVEIPEPPVGTAGEWVLREEFEGRKSFGYFICDCGRFWTSAHAYKEYSQGCQGCDFMRLPYFLWQNHEPRSGRPAEDRDAAPHDSERCEACQRGVCDRARPWYTDF